MTQPNRRLLLQAADLLKQYVDGLDRTRTFCEYCGHTTSESAERYQEVTQLEGFIRRIRQFAVQERRDEHRLR